jgi:hypothetical protein
MGKKTTSITPAYDPAADIAGERRLNFWVGIAVLALTACIVAYFTVAPMFETKPEPGRMFVAYFDDAAGIEPGDTVRVQNRHAGWVRDVQFIQHDGRLQVRVVFEIRPGPSSIWLKDHQFPADSRIRVQPGPSSRRPRLHISLGQNKEEFIEEGGEWRNARGARTESIFDVWERDRQRTDQQFADFFAHFEDEDFIRGIKDGVADVADLFDEFEAMFDGAFPDAIELTANLDAARDTLHGLRSDVSAARPGLHDSLQAAAAQSEFDDSVFDRVSEQLSSFVASLDAIQSGIEQGKRQAEDPSLGRQLLNLRRQSAQLRASWDESRKDPSRGGSMLSWRRSRHYFHGGESATEIADSAHNAAKRGGAEFTEELENRQAGR